ncbi:hypothetical protein MMPV_001934 [Pyropia vietnamensis]
MRPPQRVLLPPRPTAALVISVAAVAAATVTAWALTTRAATAGAPPPRGATLAAATAVVAAVTATIAAAVWPRFATDTLRLHGSRLPDIPLPGDWPLLGRFPSVAAAAASGGLLDLTTSWQAAVGDGVNYQVWVGWLGWRREVVLAHPTDVVHMAARVNPPRDKESMRHFGTPISDGVLLLLGNEDDRHERMRRVVAPMLGAPATAEVVATAVADAFADGGEWAARLDDAAATGEAVDIDEVLQDVGLDVIHRLLFSGPWSSAEERATARAQLATFFHLQWLSAVPAADVLAARGVAALRRVGDYFCDLVRDAEATRRAAVSAGTWNPPRKDLFEVLLADLDDPAGAYEGDWRRMAADVMGYIAAGYDTTAHSISWAIHEVLRDPPLADRLRFELAAALPPSPSSAPPPATLLRLPLATALWRETLRCHPPGALGSRRRLTTDTVLQSDGSVLPAGTVVAAPPYTLHHDGRVYLEPEVFDLGRWLGVGPRALGRTGGGRGGGTGGDAGGGQEGGGRDPARAARAAVRAARDSWLPFGTGGRGCPGVSIARIEWHAVMAALLRRYDWAPAGGPVTAAVETTLRPVGLRVRFTRR